MKVQVLIWLRGNDAQRFIFRRHPHRCAKTPPESGFEALEEKTGRISLGEVGPRRNSGLPQLCAGEDARKGVREWRLLLDFWFSGKKLEESLKTEK